MACPNRFNVNSVFSAGEDLLNGLGSQVTAFVGTSLATLRQNLLEKEDCSPTGGSFSGQEGSSAAASSTAAASSPGPTVSSTPASMASRTNGCSLCEACGIKFSYLKRRKQCSECWRAFCRGCLRKEGTLGGGSRGVCPSCWAILGSRPSPQVLASLRVRDLQAFLHSRGRPTQDLIEKGELVQRVFQVVQGGNGESAAHPPPAGSPPRADLSPPATPIVIDRASFYGDRLEDYVVAQEERGATGGEGDAEEVPSVNITRASYYEDVSQASSPQASPLRGQQGTVNKSSLEELGSEEALEDLSSRQLKELLLLHRVDYRGCCERDELLERARRLWRDNQKAQKAMESLGEEEMCKICMDAVVDCVLLDCGHLATCLTCGKQMSECPICRQFVVRVVRIFRA